VRDLVIMGLGVTYVLYSILRWVPYIFRTTGGVFGVLCSVLSFLTSMLSPCAAIFILVELLGKNDVIPLLVKLRCSVFVPETAIPEKD
jgi:H+/Cl- antiporter ClcA